MNPFYISVLRYSPFTNKLIYEIPEKDKTIYLTFDDGPNPGTTEFIIDLLNKFNAKATFFCIGNNIEKYPQTFNLYTQNGHTIGNHTYNHLNGWKTDNLTYYNDIINFDNLLKSISTINHQLSTNLFRPPYGKLKISQIRHLNKLYKIILWSVISYDYDPHTSQDKCLKNVIKGITSSHHHIITLSHSPIVVFHDSNKASKNLSFTLPRVLEHFSEKGFPFKSLTS